MKIVPQSDPSDDVHKLPDTKQKIAANEEEGENNPSTTFSLASAFEGKGTDNEGADNEGDEAVIVEDAAVGADGVNVPMKAPSYLTVDVKLDVPEVISVICFYVQQLTEATSVPREKPVCSAALCDLTRADVKTLVGGMLYFLRKEDEKIAVEKFLQCYPCMRELNGISPHFIGVNFCLLKHKLKPKIVHGNGSDGADVVMKVPRRSGTMKDKLQNNADVISTYLVQLDTQRPVPAKKPVCDTDLSDLTMGDVKTLADGMLYFLKREATDEDAIEKSLESYPCMKELNEVVESFHKLHVKVIKLGLGDKQKLAKAKLFFAAALSIGDVITDIMMIVEYFQTRSLWGYAWASLGSLLTNLIIQAVFSFAQNRAKPWQRQLKEQFFVWSLVKPGVDAWRVASGSAHEEGQMVNARYELTANKSTELVAEAIPGTLIQLSALLMSESKPTRRALFSFAFCILTAAFTSAITSWDWDLSKEMRKSKLSFYGYIPSNVKGKMKVFASLYFLSAFNLLTRSFACVLFYIKGGISEVATLLGGELLIYFVIKGLRRDLWYWAPIYGGFGVFTSWLMRWGIKVIVDWTAVVQFRHPNEVGGAYFTFSLGLTVVMGVVAALQYEKVVDDVISSPNSTFLNSTFLEDVELGEDNQIVGGEESGLEESTVVTSMIFVCAGVVVSYVTLLVSVKREYLHTFISTKTSNESMQELFTKNEEDEKRFWIFSTNRHKWEDKIGAKVKAWINERLPLWLEEPPEWFNDQKRSIIPDDFVTDPEILVRLRTNNVNKIIEQRRRSSLGDIFATQTAGGDGGGEEEDR
ncbi:hypothetical protein TrCOL_g4150 [Triparma columacea]|uniref:Uncharacterized protein n=1 Tax=Triparma columacea TaxID=722753 RepID=A0A9W7GMI2_9STRA|nr:hypothetical protein TrCOL_g4150 [Triparma columacea]